MGRGKKPDDLGEMLKKLEPRDYLFDNEGLSLSLYPVATQPGMKAYDATIAYASLKPILRADGPLGRQERKP